MNTLQKQVLIGFAFVVAVISFQSGQIILSALLFAVASICSNMLSRTLDV